MATWLNHVAVAAPRNATATHTVSPASGVVVSGVAFTPTAGRLLVVVIEGSVTSFATTAGTIPAGWTEPPNGRAINNTGLYVWWRSAAGGDSLTVSHNGSNYPVVFDFYEFAAGSTFIAANAATAVSQTGGASPAVTGLTGTNHHMFAAAADSGNNAGGTGTATWTGPTKLVDTFASGSPTDGYAYSLAYTPDSTAASTGAPTATLSGVAATSERVTFVIKIAASSASYAISGAASSGSSTAGQLTATLPGGGAAGSVSSADGTLTSAMPLAGAALSGSYAEVVGQPLVGPPLYGGQYPSGSLYPSDGTFPAAGTTGAVHRIQRIRGAAVSGGTSYAISGTAASTSSATGAGALSSPLAGAASSGSATSGGLTATGLLGGAAVSTSSTAGSGALQGGLSGAATSTSSAAGGLTAAGRISGAAVSTSATSGSGSASLALAGAAASTSAASGALAAAGRVSGAAASVSVAGGTLAAGLAVSGAALSTSTTFGGFGGIVPLSGAASSTSSTAGALSSSGPVAGAALSGSSAGGTVARTMPLAGAAVSTSSGAGSITLSGQATNYPISGTAVSGTSTAGAVRATSPVAGQATSTSAAAGTVAVAARISGAAVSTSTTGGGFGGAVLISGSAVSTSATSGSGALASPLSGSVASSTAAGGGVTAGLAVRGGSVSVSVADGALVADGPVAGAAVSGSAAAGRLSQLLLIGAAAVSFTYTSGRGDLLPAGGSGGGAHARLRLLRPSLRLAVLGETLRFDVVQQRLTLTIGDSVEPFRTDSQPTYTVQVSMDRPVVGSPPEVAYLADPAAPPVWCPTVWVDAGGTDRLAEYTVGLETGVGVLPPGEYTIRVAYETPRGRVIEDVDTVSVLG